MENTSMPPVPVQKAQQSPIVSPANSVKASHLPKILILFIVVILLLLISVGAFLLQSKKSQPTQVACTMEAKICPDGSSVGRVGPACNFAPCPTAKLTSDPTANWKTYNNVNPNFSFQYPPNLFVKTGAGIVALVDNENTNYANGGFTISVILQGSSADFNTELQQDEQNITNIQIKNITNGVEITGILNSNLVGNLHIRTVLFHSGNGAIVINSPTEYTKYIDDTTFNQILSTFKFANQNQITPSATVSCMPRPACLDATPRCMLPEPASGWCP